MLGMALLAAYQHDRLCQPGKAKHIHPAGSQDDETYREVYNYAYDFSREPGQKCVQLETALAMWQLVFSVRPWKLLTAWCNFLTEHHRRAISKDTWAQLLDFAWVSWLAHAIVCGTTAKKLP